PDPAGLQSVNPSNPQSLNRYAYVMNAPLGSVDPTGTTDCAPDSYDGSCDNSNCNLWFGCPAGGGEGGGGGGSLIQPGTGVMIGADPWSDPQFAGLVAAVEGSSFSPPDTPGACLYLNDTGTGLMPNGAGVD